MDNLLISPAPHLKSPNHNAQIMRDVLVALVPATLAAVYFFRMPALILVISGLVSAVFFEFTSALVKKTTPTPADLCSAAITGLLIALIVSPATPWWMVVVGCLVAIIFAKQLFGGLGHNIFNPALAGRAFMLASWPIIMTTWLSPFDLVASATALGENAAKVTYWQLWLGTRAGSIGETSTFAILIGAAYLFWRKSADWKIPLAYIITVAYGALLLGQDPVFHLMAGGLMLGAFFMATDPVTSPVTKTGRYIFGAGAGVLTLAIRMGGGYPEGVCYAILLMNILTPLIDRYTQRRVYGH